MLLQIIDISIDPAAKPFFTVGAGVKGYTVRSVESSINSSRHPRAYVAKVRIKL
jgi:hypothetical protein